MNREIKFRAWNGNVPPGMMYSPGQVEGWGIKHLKSEHCDLMQYTGLKDKNGKEIYEGDLLKSPYEDEGICVVEWHQHQPMYMIRRYLKNQKPFGDYQFDEITDEMEVVGNIYENPELL